MNEYKYLGIWFNKKFLIFRNRYLSMITKLRVWNTIIKPLIMYGSEIWWCDKAQMRKIEGLQLRMCKWIIGCCEKTASEVVYHELGVQRLEYQLAKNKLKWAGKVCTESNELLSGVWNMKSVFKKRRRSWESQMVEVSKSFNVEEWIAKVRKKECCRKIFINELNKNMKKSEYNWWRCSVSEKSKCRLYMKSRVVNNKLLQKYVITDYMRNIDSVSRLKF